MSADAIYATTALAARVEHRCDKTTGCWVYTGYVRPDGYVVVQIRTGGRTKALYAHRIMYQAIVGEIPDGLHLDHTCRNRSCQNPAHLEPVTPAENVLRGVGPTARNARKTHCDKGHEFTPANTGAGSRGGRDCRECNREKCRRQGAARRANLTTGVAA